MFKKNGAGFESVNVSYRGRRRRKEDRKPWPKDCVWPEPLWDGNGGYPWEPEDADWFTLDEDGQDLLDIWEYFNGLVESGRLNEDYTLNEEYEDEPDWQPEKGEDYWDNGFIVTAWEEDFQEHMNYLKIPAQAPEKDPVSHIRDIIGYEFINENLMRQAFTRRAFALEYGLAGDNEELEFLGDSVLNIVVTRECMKHFSRLETETPDAPWQVKYDEGELTRIRQQFVSKEHLSAQAENLGLDRYILYGTGEEPGSPERGM